MGQTAEMNWHASEEAHHKKICGAEKNVAGKIVAFFVLHFCTSFSFYLLNFIYLFCGEQGHFSMLLDGF